MKKTLSLFTILVIVLCISCQKKTEPTTNDTTKPNTARTVNGMTFPTQTAWFKFGVRENEGSGWTCTDADGFCEYEYTTPPEEIPHVDGQAYGEIGYHNGELIISLYVQSQFKCDTCTFYTRDGEFRWSLGATPTFSTPGFDIKDINDPDQTTAGDIHVDAGDYPIYIDAECVSIHFTTTE